MTVGNAVVLGLQWGDEGKGKVIDCIAGDCDFVVRCQGGANAGHTVVVEGKKTVLHLLPSGALHSGIRCVIGNGVVIDPLQLVKEVTELDRVGLRERLLVSDRAHLVLPSHKALDAAIEAARGADKVGTTLRGIGPCYGSKIQRTGLRAACVLDPKQFAEQVTRHVSETNRQLLMLDAPPLDAAAVVEQLLPAAKVMAGWVSDTADELHRAVRAGKRVLFEGAQGVLLDIDYGTYPFVTSSNTGVGGVITGSGLSHKELGRVIGLVKAYTTRVGSGPFPTELHCARGEALRSRGGEYGSTTGRPRRCGWLDLVVIGFACRLNGVDSLAVTKLDVLTGEPELPVCVGYMIDGKRVDTVPADLNHLAHAEPIYQTLPGWTEDIGACRSFNDLPAQARDYILFIEKQVGVQVGYIGVGPDRVQTIVR